MIIDKTEHFEALQEINKFLRIADKILDGMERERTTLLESWLDEGNGRQEQ